MRKQALLHLHRLVREAQRDMQRHAESAPVETPEYDRLDTGPHAIHHSKTAHKHAVLTLVNELASSAETEEPPAQAP